MNTSTKARALRLPARPAHDVDDSWRDAAAVAIDARARTISETVDHLVNAELALEGAYPNEVTATRNLAALLRSVVVELDSVAAGYRAERPA